MYSLTSNHAMRVALTPPCRILPNKTKQHIINAGCRLVLACKCHKPANTKGSGVLHVSCLAALGKAPKTSHDTTNNKKGYLRKHKASLNSFPSEYRFDVTCCLSFMKKVAGFLHKS